jgi:predicted transcriptional regulator
MAPQNHAARLSFSILAQLAGHLMVKLVGDVEDLDDEEEILVGVIYMEKVSLLALESYQFTDKPRFYCS